MNNRTGFKRTGFTLIGLAVSAMLTLPAAASAGSPGGHGGSSGSGGSSNHGGSNGGHGGHNSGHGGYNGGHYNGGHYSGRHGGYYGGYYGGYIGIGGYGWYGYPGYGYYGGYSAYGYPGYYGSGYTRVYPAPGVSRGALDLDVSPEGAQIYVDGTLVGIADDYDGFPDYLWLETGTYDVVIFAPGFQTISRQYSIYGGLVIDVNDDMVPGQETLPQDLVSKQTTNREERLRRDRENEAEVRAMEQQSARGYSGEEAGDAAGEAYPDRLDARGAPASLRLQIEPGDASVYLDGRFLGTGRELVRLRSGLIVDPGEHRIEVVRPGRQSQERTFSVDAGQELSLDIALVQQ